jgi:hypothetical protein
VFLRIPRGVRHRDRVLFGSSTRTDKPWRPERKSASFLNGLPELLVLRLLAERPMYGYEIVPRSVSPAERC